jgi:hypothetical protein
MSLLDQLKAKLGREPDCPICGEKATAGVEVGLFRALIFVNGKFAGHATCLRGKEKGREPHAGARLDDAPRKRAGLPAMWD